ncbi:MAG: F0F1 ATP synthase subunit gamma [Myxococcota bacterium]
MQDLQNIRRKIDSAEDLLSVASTMKSMAAVSLRQYEEAVSSLTDYHRTVEMGLQVLLRERPGLLESATEAPTRRIGFVVFGSDHGMCGSFNERIRRHVLDWRAREGFVDHEIAVLTVGHRIAMHLRDSRLSLDSHLDVPGSVDGVTAFVDEVLVLLDEWQEQRAVDHVWIFFNRASGQASFEPTTEPLLPVDRPWLERIAEREWPTRILPTFRMDGDELFSKLIQEHLFVTLFQACCESLAAENTARLSSMQSAERNIEERLDELDADYRRTRQSSITAELLDIVSGYEALVGEE